nr:delta(3,5)-Delta(2,4)-dienoyl-CoA isomerase, mitochondrial-like [Procambarus clarkii]
MLSARFMSGLLRLSPSVLSVRAMSAQPGDGYTFETLAVSVPKDHVFHVQLNRTEKLNALNKIMWREVGECFDKLAEDPDCRAVVLSGTGKLFTTGIDLGDLTQMAGIVMSDDDVARKCRALRKIISSYQESFTAIEKCPKPVISAVHNACIGAGVDLICSADIRYCSSDAWFQVKEVDVGLAADVGTLQRLPKIIGNQSLVRELCFSARKFFSSEALQCGFVSRVFEDKDSLLEAALDMASTIASKSPVAVQTTKIALVHSRDHSVQEGLDNLANINMTMLQSEDLRISAMSLMSKGKTKAVFAKL